MRNAVVSGYGRGTIVVEAGEQSGARAQARTAVEHSRPVILADLVVQRNEGAQRLLGRPSVYVASSTTEVMGHVHEVLTATRNLDSLLQELANSSR